jgi:peptidase M28-like protein
MEAARPRTVRRRPRRGSTARPLDTRLARVSALVLLVPLLLLTLTVARPGPLPAPTLPAVFDEDTALALTTELADRHPRRQPGSPGADAAARWVAAKLALYGLEVDRDTWEEELPDLGRTRLTNIAAIIPGRSRDAVVVVAHRDTTTRGPGANDNASGTAALIELARAYAAAGTAAGRAQPQHTLVFLSTDGGAYGSVGAAHFARRERFQGRVLAGVVLDGLAGRRRPRLDVAGDGSRTPAPALVRTASARIEEQTRRPPAQPSVLRQLVDLGLPFGYGDQAPLLGAGVSAVRLTTADDSGRSAATDGPERLDEVRFARLGSAAQTLLASLDGGAELARGSSPSLVVGDRFVRGWAIGLVFLAAAVPFLVVVTDLVARCRRRHVPLLPAWRSMRSRLLVALWVGVLLWLGVVVGVLPDGVARPLPPSGPAATDWPIVGLGALGVLALGGWLLARTRLRRTRPPSPEEELAGYTVALGTLGVVAIATAIASPLALLFVLPSLYAWLWLTQLHATGPRWAKDVLFSLGFAGPVLALVSLATRFGLGIDTGLYVTGLASVGYLPWTRVVLVLAWAAVAAQLGALVIGRYAPYAGGVAKPPRGPVRESVRRAVAVAQSRRR